MNSSLAHEERNIVSNVLGSNEMKIEIGPRIELAPRDTVFLGSDGVLDNTSIDELADSIRTGRIDQAARRLAKTCIDRMASLEADAPSKPDDTTFLIYRPIRHS